MSTRDTRKKKKVGIVLDLLLLVNEFAAAITTDDTEIRFARTISIADGVPSFARARCRLGFGGVCGEASNTRWMRIIALRLLCVGMAGVVRFLLYLLLDGRGVAEVLVRRGDVEGHCGFVLMGHCRQEFDYFAIGEEPVDT